MANKYAKCLLLLLERKWPKSTRVEILESGSSNLDDQLLNLGLNLVDPLLSQEMEWPEI